VFIFSRPIFGVLAALAVSGLFVVLDALLRWWSRHERCSH